MGQGAAGAHRGSDECGLCQLCLGGTMFTRAICVNIDAICALRGQRDASATSFLYLRGTATAAKKLKEVAVIQYPTFPLPPRAASATPARAGCLQAALPPRMRRALRGVCRVFAGGRRGRSPTDDSFSASARAPGGARSWGGGAGARP